MVRLSTFKFSNLRCCPLSKFYSTCSSIREWLVQLTINFGAMVEITNELESVSGESQKREFLKIKVDNRIIENDLLSLEIVKQRESYILFSYQILQLQSYHILHPYLHHEHKENYPKYRKYGQHKLRHSR
jgi:hypothetical protein